MNAVAGHLACALLTVAGAAGAQTAPLAAQTAPAGGQGRISVVGHATVELPPDYAAVQIGVVTRAPSASGALADNSAAVGRLIALAKGQGVEPGDIGTSAVSLSAAFKSVRVPGGGMDQQPDGYQAANGVTIRLGDMARLGELMRQAVEGGVNRIDGVSFGLREPGRAEREAGAAATRDAILRGRAIAEAAGIALGPIEAIRTPPAAERPARPFAELRMAAPAAGKAVPIEAGLVSVSADVEVVWAVKQP